MSVGFVIYDGDCGFCTQCANWISRNGHVKATPWQSIDDLGALGLDVEDVTTAAYWIESGVPPQRGALAVARSLEASGSYRRLLGRLIRSRLVLPLAHRFYALVAANRYRLPGSTAACKLPQP